jgi:hypothetical protein
MIVVGLTGGTGQGKSTLGRMLRSLANVDYRADLEFAYPVTEVANAWMLTWPQPLALSPDDTVITLANELIRSFPMVVEKYTGKKTTYDAYRIGNDAASLELHNRLIKYLSIWTALSDSERAVQLPVPITASNKGLHRALLQWVGGVSVALITPSIWDDLIDHRIKELAERGYKLVTVGGVRYPHDAEVIHDNGGVIVRVVRPETKLSTDVTETSMSEQKPDTEVINNGSLDELDTVTHQLFSDLESGSVKPQYSATE